MAAMFHVGDSVFNNKPLLHEKKFHFPKERNCVGAIPDIWCGGHTNLLIADVFNRVLSINLIYQFCSLAQII